jgi:hypothetical protein
MYEWGWKCIPLYLYLKMRDNVTFRPNPSISAPFRVTNGRDKIPKNVTFKSSLAWIRLRIGSFY